MTKDYASGSDKRCPTAKNLSILEIASSSKITILVDLSAPQQPFIFVMRANPEQCIVSPFSSPINAVTTANTHRPESASLFGAGRERHFEFSAANLRRPVAVRVCSLRNLVCFFAALVRRVTGFIRPRFHQPNIDVVTPSVYVGRVDLPNRQFTHISDTARWVAVYRARESERPDAVFRDPFAYGLAGERGQQIAASMPFAEKNSWPFVARTWLIDRLISEQVRGRDRQGRESCRWTRCPSVSDGSAATLQWVEVDLPEILAHKEGVLRKEKPVCALERVRLDLSDVQARRELFLQLGRRANRVLVVTEACSVYLTAEEAASLGTISRLNQRFSTRFSTSPRLRC